MAPSSVVTAKPTFVAAPSKRRPTWKAATVVRPNVKLSGSTSRLVLRAGRSVYGSRESRRPTSSQSRATASDEVGVHDVGACAAAHRRRGFRRTTSRTRSAPGPPSMRVPAAAAVEEVGAAARDRAAGRVPPSPRIASAARRPGEAVVPRRAR